MNKISGCLKQFSLLIAVSGLLVTLSSMLIGLGYQHSLLVNTNTFEEMKTWFIIYCIMTVFSFLSVIMTTFLSTFSASMGAFLEKDNH